MKLALRLVYRPSFGQIVILLGLAVSLVYAALRGGELVPGLMCPWLLFADIRCPHCGTTPALQRLLQADIVGALVVNPLVTLLALGAGLVAVQMLVQLVVGRCLRVELTHNEGRVALVVFLTAIAANWAYVLIRTGS